MISCSADMKAFHDDRVALPTAQQEKMRSHRDTNREVLKTGLAKGQRPTYEECVTQGSYAMRTMVQDPDNDFDIDDGVYFKRSALTSASGVEKSPRDTRVMVKDALADGRQFTKGPELRDRCVRVHYSDGHHIDMPVYRRVQLADGRVRPELSDGNNWVESDAQALTTWFNQKAGALARGQADNNQLRRVVRLTKKFSRSRASWKASTTSGICITKLCVDGFVESEGEDSALVGTWNNVLLALNKSLSVSHPVLPGQLLSKGPNDPEVGFFRDKLAWAIGILAELARPGCDRARALEIWDEVFGETYFRGRTPTGNSGGGKNIFSAPASTKGGAAKREDGDGRYGGR